jgi:Flp pilus assembly protein TadG
MKSILSARSATKHFGRHCNRQGTVIVLAACMMVVVIGIAGFTVDFALVNVTKGQVQNAADSAAHAAMQELLKSLGPGGTVTPSAAASLAKTTAADMTRRFRSGDVSSTQLQPERDMRFGCRSWNASTNSWDQQWGVTPYNMVEVTVRRTAAADAPLGAVFAKVLGRHSFDVEARAVASVAPAKGFGLPDNSTASIDILPIALDLTTWNSLLAQIYNGTNSGFSDRHLYNTAAGSVSNSADGVPEVNIYPDANSAMPSGNRGTVDIGSPNNSTADLKRQIQYGINASDLAWFPNGELRFNDDGILSLNGDTGISAGIESALKSIVGHVRAIPIFIQVSGPGNNAQFTITRFVGVRIMAVKLTGGPSQRYLRVQPAPYSTRYALRGNVPVTVDGIMSQPLLVE